jgi:hypothetical protein
MRHNDRMLAMQCPTCTKEVRGPPENKAFPFCSSRCRTIDLGKWLDGDFRIPLRHIEEDEDGLSASSPQPSPAQEPFTPAKSSARDP